MREMKKNNIGKCKRKETSCEKKNGTCVRNGGQKKVDMTKHETAVKCL